MQTQNLTQQEKEALFEVTKLRMEQERIYFYAESLKKKWTDIYAGDLANPSVDDIKVCPGPWLKSNPFHPSPFLAFAHQYQRKMTFPFENETAFGKLKNAIYHLYFAG